MTATYDLNDDINPKALKLTKKRLIIAAAVALALHLFFLGVVAPILKFDTTPMAPTEVTQISQEELDKIKQQIAKQNKTLPPLVKQELREEFKSKEAPKDAKHMGAFNQTVPEEMIAGAQQDAPEDGGGSKAQQKSQQKQEHAKPKSLANLGFGAKLTEDLVKSTKEETPSPIQGKTGPYRPVGREDPKMKHGNQNLLNAVENEYYSFFARFEEPIIRNWFFMIRQAEGKIRSEMAARRMGVGSEADVAIEFTIDRKGAFTSIQVIRSSSLPTLDAVTREAVRKLGSLPNPPPAVFEGGQYFTYRLQFRVTVDDNPMSSARPGMDWY